MAYRLIDTWKPNRKSQGILSLSLEHVQSVDYKVSARWVFYRLLQAGIYRAKEDYFTFSSLLSKARHAQWGGWHPLTLADETRDMLPYVSGGEHPHPDIELLVEHGVMEAVEDLEYYRGQIESYKYRSEYQVDQNYLHDNVVAVMFEARAMIQQFRKYTKGVTLCPFGGQPSIPYKYKIAQYLEDEARTYRKPVKILYFGDLDEKGVEIFETGKADISKWCRADLDFTWCGLTEEQVARYGIPENIDHVGYQWEALTDPQAREIIRMGMEPYFNFEAEDQARELSSSIKSRVNQGVNLQIANERGEL